MNYALFFVFNIFYVPWFVIISLVLAFLVTLAISFSYIMGGHRHAMRVFRFGIAWYARTLIKFFYPYVRVRCEYFEKSDATEPYIFVSNHRSFVDSYLLAYLPYEGVLIVNTWPFRIPVLGYYAKLAGYLNINKMAPDVFFEKARRLLEENVSLVFFPEGTRSIGRAMGKFHGTAFRLALQSKMPLVPLCVTGTEKILPKGSLLIRPGKLTIRRLRAIPWEEYKDLTAFALKNRIRRIIGEELERMENPA